jgi:protein O-GlcNAc transferase
VAAARRCPSHRRGELCEAEALYRQILDTQPGHLDALHLCGVLVQQRGLPEEAVGLIGATLSVNAGLAPAHSNYRLALAALGRTEEALAAYDSAIALTPDYAEALYIRGNALTALGRLDDVLASFERAIAIRSDYAKATSGSGNGGHA